MNIFHFHIVANYTYPFQIHQQYVIVSLIQLVGTIHDICGVQIPVTTKKIHQ